MHATQVVLTAVKLTESGDFAGLSQLLRTHPLESTLIFRILLTYLAEGLDPDSYIPLVQEIAASTSSSHTQDQDYYRNDGIQLEGDNRARDLRLLPLSFPNQPVEDDDDPLTLFLLHKAHKIDRETGSLESSRKLIEPFLTRSETLRTWAISVLLPLLRLEYGYPPDVHQSIALARFEQLPQTDVLANFLPNDFNAVSKVEDNPVRDIRGLVGPHMYKYRARKRRKLSHNEQESRRPVEEVGNDPSEGTVHHGWAYVNEWIFNLSHHNLRTAVDTIEAWDGPADVDYGDWGDELSMTDSGNDSEGRDAYITTILATLVANTSLSHGALEFSARLLRRAYTLKGIKLAPESGSSRLSPQSVERISAMHMSRSRLLSPDNPLTEPSETTLAFFDIVIRSATKLVEFGLSKSCQDIVDLILFRSHEDQRSELRRVLQSLKEEKLNDQAWLSARGGLLWLRDWTTKQADPSIQRCGIFCQIQLDELELAFLRTMLDAGCYRLVVDLYLKKDSPLNEDVVKETILNAASAYYDAATNGNRTRGQMKKAYDVLQFFRGQIASKRLRHFETLLAATHSISFYSLTLQQGVPFLPVNIRAHRDPMSLIGKILQQNPRSYTHLDDLLDIGQNLVRAGGLDDDENDASPLHPEGGSDLATKELIARRKVTRLAIVAALAEDDFDTAYSYVVNRLHQEAKADNQSQMVGQYDDISWRAAYAAGRYPTSQDGTSALRRIEQRMELLSQALLLAPPPALSELLTIWQTCEQNLNEILAQDNAHDDVADQLNDHHVPGGFSRTSSPPPQKSRAQMKRSIQEEAPMGLFDAAREVGTALGRSAFPLRGLQRQGPDSQAREREQDEADGADGANRVRKRDMVSNMVTGGLASGIGWVIGAPPVRD